MSTSPSFIPTNRDQDLIPGDLFKCSRSDVCFSTTMYTICKHRCRFSEEITRINASKLHNFLFNRNYLISFHCMRPIQFKPELVLQQSTHACSSWDTQMDRSVVKDVINCKQWVWWDGQHPHHDNTDQTCWNRKYIKTNTHLVKCIYKVSVSRNVLIREITDFIMMFITASYVSRNPLEGIPNFRQSPANSDWIMTFWCSSYSKLRLYIF